MLLCLVVVVVACTKQSGLELTLDATRPARERVNAIQ
jgi:hypothetical protein